MRRTEALQGVRMAVFLNILNRWELAELNQEEAAELLGVSERTFRCRLRGGGRGRALGPQARQGVGQAGSGRPGRGGGAALSRALPGLHRQALPRASDEGPWLRLGLHLDEAASSVDGRGGEGAAQGRASEEARAAAVAGDDGASGRLAPRLARRPGGARPDRDDGRRDGGDLLGLSRGGGGHGLDLPGAERGLFASMACR